MNPSPDLHDVQGLVARGYANLAAASFTVVEIGDASAGRAWLTRLLPTLTPADVRPQRRAVHVALTSSGLRKISLDETALAQFASEYVGGMTTAERRRMLGDVGDNAPEHWDWGGPTTPDVDAVLLLYAIDEPELANLRREQTIATGAGLQVLADLGTSNLQGREPFGFRDGISQPFVEGLSKTGTPELTVRFGEFVLGYLNEYGRYTDRPILDPAADPDHILPLDPNTGRPDLGRNGTYLVFRQFEQDVPGFWQFLDRAAAGDPQRRVQLAAKLVGRWPSGAPLVLAPDNDEPSLTAANDFAYHTEDAHGARCPIGAHIRRANPRDSLDPQPGTSKSFAINRRHRILRRGREYGSLLSPEEALITSSNDERGLHFICLNGNISRQFELVQNTWVNNPKFDGLYDDADPIVGPSEPFGGTFTIQTDTIRERHVGVPRFVSVRGGAYFFLPGLAATRYLAALGS